MTQVIYDQLSALDKFPIQLRVMSDKESKEYHLKKLYEMSLKSLGEIPQLEEPDYFQMRWVLFRLSHSITWPKVHENKIGDYKNWDKGDLKNEG